jgi:hypothetical protein
MKRLENVILFMSPRGVMQFDGARLQPLSVSYDPTRYQKEKMTMKPGPYKSSTHGNITLSERGRTLLAAERDAVQGAIRAGNFSTNDQSLSRARGDIALYISHLERFPVGGNEFEKRNYLDECERERKKVAAEQDARAHQAAKRDAVFKDIMDSTVRRWARYPFYTIGLDLAAAEPTKEQTMNDKTNGEAGPAAEKTRSAILSEATAELVKAQHHLELIQNVPDGPPAELTICTYTHGNLAGAISDLVKDQWAALAKKAVARAKARVAKAEKAVAALLA